MKNNQNLPIRQLVRLRDKHTRIQSHTAWSHLGWSIDYGILQLPTISKFTESISYTISLRQLVRMIVDMYHPSYHSQIREITCTRNRVYVYFKDYSTRRFKDHIEAYVRAINAATDSGLEFII